MFLQMQCKSDSSSEDLEILNDYPYYTPIQFFSYIKQNNPACTRAGMVFLMFV